MALLLGKTEDDEGYHLLRRRSEDAEVELGTIRPMREGKPVNGEVVSLRPRKDVPFVYDVKTELDVSQDQGPRLTSDGPPQVATEEYRRGWDAIWGRKRRAPSASDKLN